ELPVMANGGLTAPIMIDLDELKENSTKALQKMQEKLLAENKHPSLQIETLSDYNTVMNGVKHAVKTLDAKLIIMGITGSSAIEQSLIGSNTIDVAKEANVPVIIIPPNAVFRSIQNTFLACSLQGLNENLPHTNIVDFLQKSKSNFGIVHIEKDLNKKYNDQDFLNTTVDSLFKMFNTKHQVVYNPDFVEGINHFIDNNKVDLLIVIPKKHGFFDRLFNKSHTKMLAFHSHVPLMVIHD
ncbi:MAG TPA: universal stress protein, partial [Chitinophagaceae bacterium]|nr:universal stress protein [Chitinophagaceae bacterium]